MESHAPNLENDMSDLFPLIRAYLVARQKILLREANDAVLRAQDNRASPFTRMEWTDLAAFARTELDMVKKAVAELDAVPTVGPPMIVVHMDGGIIQSTSVDRPCEIMVIDYDCEGSDEAEITEVDQGGDGSFEDAIVFMAPLDLEPEYCRGRMSSFAASEGKAC